MGLFGRHQLDDVDVESCLENLERVNELVVPRYGRRVIDLRRDEEDDAVGLDERAEPVVGTTRRR